MGTNSKRLSFRKMLKEISKETKTAEFKLCMRISTFVTLNHEIGRNVPSLLLQ